MIHSTRRFYELFVFLLACANSNNIYAQKSPWHVRGLIVDENLRPIGAATVVLIDSDSEVVSKVTTDSTGRFNLYCDATGKHTLLVKLMTYLDYRSMEFQLEDKDFGTIKLHPMSIDLKEVSIQAKQDLIELEGNNIIYNVGNSISSQGISALEVLKKAPGVAFDNESSISLNGKQGVLIYLDGRQTYLSGNEIIDLLKSLPSSQIRSIEIINSPNAKYDAAGSAGIINIRTVKSQFDGFNGVMTTGASYGITAKQNQDISFNYRKNRYNIYGSYNHFLGNYTYLYGSERIQSGNKYDSHTDDIDRRQKMNGRIGMDYTLDDRNTIGILLNGNFLFGGGRTDTRTDIYTPNTEAIEQILEAFNDYYSQHTERYNVNLNYKFEDTLGHFLNIDADYGHFNKGNGNLQSNSYTDSQGNLTSQNLYRTLNDMQIDLKGLKLDYGTNLWKGKLEAGAKYASTRSDNDSRFFHVLGDRDSLDEQRSNNFIFDEHITSAYLNYGKTMGKWSISAGLRLESSDSRGSLYFRNNGTDSTNTIDRDYTSLFPSLSISVKPRDGHNLSLAYSRRIDRPAYQELNPFVYLLDELSFWQGNPFLQAQLTHRIVLQYALKKTTIVGLTFAHTDEFSANITDTLEQEKIVMVTRNLGVQNHLSLTATQHVYPAKWWDMTFNGLLYYLHNDIAFDQYRNLNLEQLACRISLQQTFKLPYSITGELTSVFNTRRLSGANTISRANGRIDLGLQRAFLHDNASLRLVISDLYKGSQYISTQNFDGFSYRNYGYYESRQIRLNLTYRFADKNVKGPRKRDSALDNENERIK